MIVYYIMIYYLQFIIKNGSVNLNPSLNETPGARSHPKISPVKTVNAIAIHGRGGVISLKCMARAKV